MSTKRIALRYKKAVLAAGVGLLSLSLPTAYGYGYINIPTPTIDSLDRSDISTVYNLTGTSETSGDHIYNIPTVDLENGTVTNHYYFLDADPTGSNTRYSYKVSDEGKTLINHYVNIVQSPASTSAVGSGIYNNKPSGSSATAVLGDIIGDFIENACITESYAAHGAGLDNHGIIGNIYGDFIGNTLYTESYTGTLQVDGGGLRNGNQIASITGNFIGNTADAGGDTEAFGGGLANRKSTNDSTSVTSIDSIHANFISNSAKTGGGAIYNNHASIGNLEGYFVNNSSTNGSGGGIYNTDEATIDEVKGVFAANSAAENGGAIYNTSGAQINITESSFIANTAKNGGAIYNDSATASQVNLSVDGSFINNTATEHGGAIYSSADIDLIAIGHKNVIKGNTANGSAEAIYMEGTPEETDSEGNVTTPAVVPNLNIKTENNGEWEINDEISGTVGLYNVNISGDGTGTVSLFNDINGGNVTIDSTRLNTTNNDIHVYDFNSFEVSGDSSMTVDVDLNGETMDRITADSYSNNGGILDVTGMNFLSYTNKKNVSILFAQEDLAPYVRNFGGDIGSTHRVYTPVKIYDIQYNIHANDNQGYFEFTNQFNPAALVAPVILQAGAQSALNTTLKHAFNHLDTYTKLPYSERLAIMNGNKYAMASTDFNNNINYGLSDYNARYDRTTNQGIWIRPYSAFESIPLKHGPKVNSISYGSFVGFDSDFHEHRNGWHSVWSVYGGYNGGLLDFKGISANYNGGVIGITDTFYKGNFWTALTATTGAMIADITTMYGHEDSTSLYSGIASKTGYNIEFKDGKYILQPMMKLSYSFAKTLNYTNAAGSKVDVDPLHTIQLHPQFRFIGNFKNGWQPYASCGIVWNLLNDTNVTVEGYPLPDMHMRPYVEYGLGVQKVHGHRFLGFGQAMVRNGGRNGVSLTFGFRYSLGRDNQDYKNKTFWQKVKAFFVS